VQALPDPSALPVAQAAPTGHPAAAAQFLGQPLPRDAAFQDKDDAGQCSTITDTRPPPFGLGWLWRQQRFDGRPQGIRNYWFTHTSSLSHECKVLLGVLILQPHL
jgi:hypothetical protein